MNRATRRRQAMKIATAVIKSKEKSMEQRQYGFGVVLTTHLGVIMFWRWTWTLFDRRAR